MRGIMFMVAGLICLGVMFGANYVQDITIEGHYGKLSLIMGIGAAAGFIKIASSRGWLGKPFDDSLSLLKREDETPTFREIK